MSRSFRFLASLVSVAAFAVMLMLLVPSGASGGERDPAPVQHSGDLFFFGRDAQVRGAVDGAVQVFGGSADLDADVAGDVIVLGGDVIIRDGARIRGNLIHGGGTVRGAVANVEGKNWSLTSLRGAAATVTKTAFVVALVLLWLIVAVAVTLVGGREVRYSSLEVRTSALHCFALGLVAFTSFVITAIVFSFLVPFLVGVPLLVALGAIAVVTKVYGLVAVFHAVGSIIARAKTREQLESRRFLRGDLAMVVVGVLVLGAIRLIPVVGTIVWSCASVFGIGCALATRFGRREPAFLAWRPAEAR